MPVERITVIKFGANDRGSNGTGGLHAVDESRYGRIQRS